MKNVRVFLQDAGPTVFKPKAQSQLFSVSKRNTTQFSSVRFSFTYHVIFGIGDPKEEQSNKAWWFLMIW